MIGAIDFLAVRRSYQLEEDWPTYLRLVEITQLDGGVVTLTLAYSGGAWKLSLGSGSLVTVTAESQALVEDEYGHVARVWVGTDLVAGDWDITEVLVDDMTIPSVSLGDSPFSSLVFEEIARDTYDDPLLGILLRQLNIMDTGAGGQYILPTASELGKENIQPESHIFNQLADLNWFYDLKGQE